MLQASDFEVKTPVAINTAHKFQGSRVAAPGCRSRHEHTVQELGRSIRTFGRFLEI